jgi:acyl-CoA thioester hydrolase
LEGGRVALLRDPDKGLMVADATFVLARIEIDFLRELHFPGDIDIGTSVAEIGTRSFTFTQAIFRDGACAATGRATMVLIDRATRRPRSLPENTVARLQALRRPDTASRAED